MKHDPQVDTDRSVVAPTSHDLSQPVEEVNPVITERLDNSTETD